MNRPHGIIFDLGDTILKQIKWDPMTGNKEMLKLAHNPDKIPEEKVQKIADKLAKEIDVIRNKSMIEFGCQSFHRVLYESLNISFNLTPLELEIIFWDSAVQYTPVDNIFDLLDVLDKHGIKKGVLSNSVFTGKVLERELSKHNLKNRFDFVMSSIDYGFRKPNKHFFDVAIKKMDLPKKHIWFAGDKLEYDILGAVNTGIFPIWYNPDKKKGDKKLAHYEINDWSMLIDIIEKLYSKT